MTKISEKLGDLSVRVGDIEARAEAFTSECEETRNQKVAELQANAKSQRDRIESAVQSKGDEISAAWTSLNQSMCEKAERVYKQIEAKKDTVDATRARDRADWLEANAMLAIDFAIAAMEDAELAAAQAIDARLHADSFEKEVIG